MAIEPTEELTDFDRHPEGYVDLTEIAKHCHSYTEYVMMCDMRDTTPGTEDEYNRYVCNGGGIAQHIHPTKSYMATWKDLD